MGSRRKNAAFLPYRFVDGHLCVFLQRRDLDAKRHPDLFGLFGGGIEEGETVEQGLMREVKEELNYSPKGCKYFTHYESSEHIEDVFVCEVDENFENEIEIIEGQYGKYFKKEEILAEKEMMEGARAILLEFFEKYGK
ncbi:MAG: NUDIX domain-containing protein [bacterium]|nr:NUDIX domain-containing protein [bacterium]